MFFCIELGGGIDITLDSDGPCDVSWFLNDKFHRENGPAYEFADGTKFWYFNGKRHREDGPAIEYADGRKSWCLKGKAVTQEEVMKCSF